MEPILRQKFLPCCTLFVGSVQKLRLKGALIRFLSFTIADGVDAPVFRCPYGLPELAVIQAIGL